jgi:hypothetical protein
MALGAGKYDDLCSMARRCCNASGAILIILGGDRGNGFAAQIPGRDELGVTLQTIDLLKQLLQVVEEDYRRLTARAD